MKIFVTGGTGFIGSHLVDLLLKKQNDEVRCLVRSDEKWLQGKDFRKIPGDLHDLDALAKGMQDVDVVYHIAGKVAAPSQSQFNQANVDGTENLLRLAMKMGVGKMVILSSLAASGPSFQRPLTEEDPLYPETMYGRSKKEMEEMIHRVADNRISVTLIRPPAVYGPREEQIFRVFQMASWKIFPIIGDGQNTRVSLIYIQDLVDGMILAASEASIGVQTYFLADANTYTWDEIRKTTAQVMGKKLYPLRVSPRFVEKFGIFTEKAASLIGQYPVINREKARELGMQWTCSPKKAEKSLGFQAKTSLSEGLSETIGWYRRHGWLP